MQNLTITKLKVW